ncbi:MAG: hypothetical protein ACYCUM_12325 [Solirubrobacteraceae bacterium]
MSRLPQMRAALLAAAERQAAERRDQAEHARKGRRSRGVAGRARVLVVVFAVLLALAGAAFAASQLIQTGAPVKSGRFNEKVGVGVAMPATRGLLGIAAPDPAGGPRWTMRAYKTSRGLGCVQIGRLLDGRIGVLGQDGAFADDGLFHPLPVQVNQSWGSCVLLDARGQTFLSMAAYDLPASGQEASCQRKRCASGQGRDIFYGLLGPDARSIVYEVHKQRHRLATVGSQGAYLIVLPASAAASITRATTVAGIVPSGTARQPIRSITYTGGRTCTTTASGNRNQDGKPCQPVGYHPVSTPLPGPRQLASRVRVEQILPRARGGQGKLEISFAAHAPVTGARSEYTVTIGSPGGGSCKSGAVQRSKPINQDVSIGERLHVSFPARGYPGSLFPYCWGTYDGEVSYTVAPKGPSRLTLAGAAAPPTQLAHALGLRIVLVGRFSYKVTRAEATAGTKAR